MTVKPYLNKGLCPTLDSSFLLELIRFPCSYLPSSQVFPFLHSGGFEDYFLRLTSITALPLSSLFGSSLWTVASIYFSFLFVFALFSLLHLWPFFYPWGYSRCVFCLFFSCGAEGFCLLVFFFPLVSICKLGIFWSYFKEGLGASSCVLLSLFYYLPFLGSSLRVFYLPFLSLLPFPYLFPYFALMFPSSKDFLLFTLFISLFSSDKDLFWAFFVGQLFSLPLSIPPLGGKKAGGCLPPFFCP